jgi:hypothetical protein
VLKLRGIGLDTQHENVVLIARSCQDFRAEEYQAYRKVEITGPGGRRLLSTVAIVDDESIVARDELGMAKATFRRLGLAAGTPVAIAPASPPHSLEAVRAKIRNCILAHDDGVIRAIDCYRLGRIARLAGAPLDKSAGIDLFKKVGDRVEKGETLYEIHSCIESDFAFASELALTENGYNIGAI